MTLDITVTDMFCGAGGSTTGATQVGASVQLAINHWDRAIETHNRNYPDTTHILTDLHAASPRRFPHTTILIASPECTSHTLAKGRKRKGERTDLWGLEEPDPKAEAEERSRCTMWTPLDWAECHDYEAIILENVVDAHLWRPFSSWLAAWKSLGYDYQIVYLNSMHVHPTPQSRDRMYVVAWNQGNPKPDLTICPTAFCAGCDKEIQAIQSWKNPARKYGKYRQQYLYRCPQCAKEVTPYYEPAATAIDWSVPAPRIADRKRPLQQKTMQRIGYGLEKFGRSDPFLLDHLGEYRSRPIRGPVSTICAGGNHHSLVTPPGQSWLLSYYNHGQLVPTSQTIPTVTTLDRHGLLTSERHQTGPIAVEDCGFRMLIPKEIQAAMAFPSEYQLTGTRREQVKQLGNAVTPPVMKLLMERVIVSLS